jgi:hypothetical protein
MGVHQQPWPQQPLQRQRWEQQPWQQQQQRWQVLQPTADMFTASSSGSSQPADPRTPTYFEMLLLDAKSRWFLSRLQSTVSA